MTKAYYWLNGTLCVMKRAKIDINRMEMGTHESALITLTWMAVKSLLDVMRNTVHRWCEWVSRTSQPAQLIRKEGRKEAGRMDSPWPEAWLRNHRIPAQNSPISSKQLADLDTPSLEPTSQDAWDHPSARNNLPCPHRLPTPPHRSLSLSLAIYIHINIINRVSGVVIIMMDGWVLLEAPRK